MSESIPFRVDSVAGLAQSVGVCWLEDEALVLEFRTKDTVFGVLQGDVREVRLPFDQLVAVEHLSVPFSARLRIRSKRIATLAEIPGADGTQVTLKHKARDRQALKTLSETVQARLAER